MTKRKKVFRRSIWDADKRYVLPENLSQPEVAEMIKTLRWVEAAKKRVPPIPDQGLLAIARFAALVPEPKEAKPDTIATFLRDATSVFGAGPAVCICMLAVLKGGEYPPMDRKIVEGLLKMEAVSKDEAASLSSADSGSFANVYFEKVIPAWNAARAEGKRTPEQADEYIARGGNDS